MRHADVTECFLCGEPLEPGQATDIGHALALSFVPTCWRDQIPAPGLVTYPVHESCNRAMGKNELWVLHDLGKAAEGATGEALRADLRARYLKKRTDRLIHEAVRKQWREMGERLVLPNAELVPTPYHPAKADAVLRAIVRGYFFHLTGRVIRDPARLDVTKLYSRHEVREMNAAMPFVDALLEAPSVTGISGVLALHMVCLWDADQRLRSHAFVIILWDSFAAAGQVLEPF